MNSFFPATNFSWKTNLLVTHSTAKMEADAGAGPAQGHVPDLALDLHPQFDNMALALANLGKNSIQQEISISM